MESSFGASGTALQWFGSYLGGRSQRIFINGSYSDTFDLRFGVPQVSYLEPLLFTIYASKLFEVKKNHLLEVHANADDTQLYLSFSPDSHTSQWMLFMLLRLY